MSRIENNKFQLNEEVFNIKDAVNEIVEIMEFQIQLKNLKFEIDISPWVPL